MHDANMLFYSRYSRIAVGLAVIDEESSRKLRQTRDFPIILARDPKPTDMLENTLLSDIAHLISLYSARRQRKRKALPAQGSS